MTDEAALLRRVYAAWNSSADFDAIAEAYYHPEVAHLGDQPVLESHEVPATRPSRPRGEPGRE